MLFRSSLEEIRQWLLLYGKSGTRAQTDALFAMANRQLVELNRQRSELDSAIADLSALRDRAEANLSG